MATILNTVRSEPFSYLMETHVLESDWEEVKKEKMTQTVSLMGVEIVRASLFKGQ